MTTHVDTPLWTAEKQNKDVQVLQAAEADKAWGTQEQGAIAKTPSQGPSTIEDSGVGTASKLVSHPTKPYSK